MMQFSTTSACVGGVLFLCLAQTAHAEFNYLVRGGIDLGGDELAHAYFTNGDEQEIKAGEILHLAIGGIFGSASASQPGFETEMTIGWKFDSINGKNGDISWDRFPFEVLEFYRTGSWRFGGGLTYHMNPKLSGSGVAASLGTVSFDDALGVVAEIDRLTDTGLLIGGRITLIDYERSNQTFSGNSIGVTMGYRF